MTAQEKIQWAFSLFWELFMISLFGHFWVVLGNTLLEEKMYPYKKMQRLRIKLKFSIIEWKKKKGRLTMWKQLYESCPTLSDVRRCEFGWLSKHLIIEMREWNTYDANQRCTVHFKLWEPLIVQSFLLFFTLYLQKWYFNNFKYSHFNPIQKFRWLGEDGFLCQVHV